MPWKISYPDAPPVWTRILDRHEQTWPPLDEDVLLCLLGGGIIVGCLALHEDDEGGASCHYVYAEPGGDSTPLDAEPTHWMPLPKGPQEWTR